jgi:hypothetical protein
MAAEKACAGRMPLQPPEMRAETNPNYVEDFSAEIKCINDGGLSVTALPNQGGWTYNGQPTMSEGQQDALEAKCQLKSYSHKK